MQNIEISIFGLLSLIGLIQTVYAFVYLLFRAGDLRRAVYPLTFFFTLAGGFLLTFVTPYTPDLKYISLINQFFWVSVPIVSVVMLVQIVSIERTPSVYYQILLFLLFPLYILSFLFSVLLPVFSIIFSGISLLAFWVQKKSVDALWHNKVSGRERYWLILSVIFMNVILLVLIYARLSGWISLDEFTMIRIIVGLGLVYLVSTTMFRLYPQAIQLVDRQILKLLRADETIEKSNPELVAKLKDIIEIQKLYQEVGFSRTDLAREMGLSETVTSKLLNDVYGKSLPQLVNERRIAEACDLLVQTDQNIAVIAEQVGFNSIASFNRVFKDIRGESPTEYRRNNQKK